MEPAMNADGVILAVRPALSATRAAILGLRRAGRFTLWVAACAGKAGVGRRVRPGIGWLA